MLPLRVRCPHSQAYSLLRYVCPPLRSNPTLDLRAPFPGEPSVSGNTDGEPLTPRCLQLCGVSDISGYIIKTKIGTENDLEKVSSGLTRPGLRRAQTGAACEILNYPQPNLRGQILKRAGGRAREAVSAFIHTAGGFTVSSSRKSQRVFVGMLLIVGCKEGPRQYI